MVIPLKDLYPVLDPPWNKDLRSDNFLKKGSRSGSLDPESKDPKCMLFLSIINMITMDLSQ